MAETDKRYWFRAKKYGWGWGIPQTWQGWTVLIVYAAAVSLLAAMTLGDNKETAADILLFVIGMTIPTISLIYICYKKGEQPRWRWGGKDG